MLKRILLIPFIFCASILFAQETTKLSFSVVQKIEAAGDSDQKIKALVKGDISTIKTLTRLHGGRFNYAAGDIASIEIAPKKIPLLVANRNIQRIESEDYKRLEPMNDTTLVKSNVMEIHAGLSPLNQAYDGDGIVMGIIDTGIDFNHPDFQDSTGNTRILYLWDHSQPKDTNTPTPYNYGQEWTNVDIDSGRASAHNDLSHFGHGTHVAGIACGNGFALRLDSAFNDTIFSKGYVTNEFNYYTGVAPSTDIIFVAYDFNGGGAYRIADAVHYIFEKAKALGKPCVINASLGDYYGSHDGKDFEALLIDNLITEQNGRSLVAAAGNAGGVPFHVGYNTDSDTTFTWFKYSGGAIDLELYGEQNDFENISFAVGADQTNPGFKYRGRSDFTKVTDNLGVTVRDTLYNDNGDRLALLYYYGELNGSTYKFNIRINPDSTSYYYRLMATGTGRFDAWNFDAIATGLPSSLSFPDILKYKSPDISQTLVSSFQCSDEVITVANFTNKNSHINVRGNLHVELSMVSGARASNSSEGPTRDGRVKPDVAATGAYDIAAGLLSMLPGTSSSDPGQVGIGGMHWRGGGTSAASPVVAGVAALYLQMNPNATNKEIRNAILNCAKEDQFTGTNLPNSSWGYGKVNAFAALTTCAVGINETEKVKGNFFQAYPNPSRDEITIEFDLNTFSSKNASLELFDLLGNKIADHTVQAERLILSKEELPAGIYMANLIVDGKVLQSQKLIIL